MASSQPPNSAFTFLAQGALIQEFKVGDQNIVLGFPEPKFYSTHNAPYFGETIGRTTNRIKDAKLTNLNGKNYPLAANDGPNCLHGGLQGWGKRIFDGPSKVSRNGKEGVYFSYVSKDMEEGYPGTVECQVWYTAGVEGDTTVLDVEYQVELIGDECAETVVGVTNHSYFNVNPTAPTIEGTIVTLSTDQHLEVDATQIPTGTITAHPSAPAPHTPFTLGPASPSFDHCFVLDPPNIIPLDTRPLPLRSQVTLHHPHSKIHLDVRSTEPAFQFYTGEGISVPELDGANGTIPALGSRAGIAIEPSRYIDATREEWRNQCLIRKGEIWGAKSQYRAWME